MLGRDFTNEEKRDLVEVSFSYNVRGLMRVWLDEDVVLGVIRHIEVASPELGSLADTLRQPESASGLELSQSLRGSADAEADFAHLEDIAGSSFHG